MTQQATALLNDLRAAVSNDARWRGLHTELDELQKRLSMPMRVAVVGQIKTGKSTLMNALLGEVLLPTDFTETTYNINWLRHGHTPKAVIRWRDGRAENVPLSDIVTWTARQGAPKNADEVRYMDIYAPVEVLKRVELIDTPGLGSSYEVDSQKTAAFLQIADDASDREASEADAIVFVFRRSMHEDDERALRAFQRAAQGRVSPLNAIGVLSQIDHYWPAAPDPMAAAGRVIESLKSKETVRNTLYDVAPLSALMAQAPFAVDAVAREALSALAAVSDDEFRWLTANAARFIEEAPQAGAASVEGRKRLVLQLGLYGVERARRLCAAQGVDGALRAVREESGVPQLMALLERHFGQRASLIKLLYGLLKLRRIATQLIDSSDPSAGAIGRAWQERIETFSLGNTTALRLDLLRAIYAGETDFTKREIEEVRAAAGEFGEGRRERFGEASTAALEERIAYWRRRRMESREIGARAEFAAHAMCALLEEAIRMPE